MTATTSALGGTVRRRQDPALIRGRGGYVDDVVPVGTSQVAFIRSAFAHALDPLGVKHIDMALIPKRIWAAIQEARG